ncbi:MAG: NADAR family protein [Muribaculaceae bacterium]|nr:NADAR family protein [Muribaculaceae bacterium]
MSFYSIAQFIEKYYPQYYSIETYPASKCAPFCKTNETWGIFSNFGKTPIVIDGVTFKNSEQLFQLMKFKDREPVMEIYNAPQPKYPAKKWEKQLRREDWGSMIVNAMKFCLMRKYEQNEDFRQELERSRGLFIVEDQSNRKKKENQNPDTWGVKLRGDQYIGPNLMGRLLMELRDNGKLEYNLPKDSFDFIRFLK